MHPFSIWPVPQTAKEATRFIMNGFVVLILSQLSPDNLVSSQMGISSLGQTEELPQVKDNGCTYQLCPTAVYFIEHSRIATKCNVGVLPKRKQRRYLDIFILV